MLKNPNCLTKDFLCLSLALKETLALKDASNNSYESIIGNKLPQMTENLFEGVWKLNALLSHKLKENIGNIIHSLNSKEKMNSSYPDLFLNNPYGQLINMLISANELHVRQEKTALYIVCDGLENQCIQNNRVEDNDFFHTDSRETINEICWTKNSFLINYYNPSGDKISLIFTAYPLTKKLLIKYQIIHHSFFNPISQSFVYDFVKL